MQEIELKEKYSKSVIVLGVEYEILFKKRVEDSALANSAGYCDVYDKRIVIADEYEKIKKDPCSTTNLKDYFDDIIRHEIIHAFLYESGLWSCSFAETWALNEEMVDWFAIQFVKIKSAFEDVGCIKV